MTSESCILEPSFQIDPSNSCKGLFIAGRELPLESGFGNQVALDLDGVLQGKIGKRLGKQVRRQAKRGLKVCFFDPAAEVNCDESRALP